jgi:hypothetical protein
VTRITAPGDFAGAAIRVVSPDRSANPERALLDELFAVVGGVVLGIVVAGLPPSA